MAPNACIFRVKHQMAVSDLAFVAYPKVLTGCILLFLQLEETRMEREDCDGGVPACCSFIFLQSDDGDMLTNLFFPSPHLTLYFNKRNVLIIH